MVWRINRFPCHRRDQNRAKSIPGRLLRVSLQDLPTTTVLCNTSREHFEQPSVPYVLPYLLPYVLPNVLYSRKEKQGPPSARICN